MEVINKSAYRTGHCDPYLFPIDKVPLDARFFNWFCKANPHIFLHVWIQVESKHVPVVLYYRCSPLANKIPVHLLFVGPSIEGKENYGHYVCIKNIDKLFYRIEKSSKKTKHYCPWCCTYSVYGGVRYIRAIYQLTKHQCAESA